MFVPMCGLIAVVNKWDLVEEKDANTARRGQEELIAKARDAGCERLSLSVEPGNPARKLYERHGFEVVDEGAEAWTMVASLASPPTTD